ncbi:Coiled-coil domain-containing protein 61 [Perkinsus chesapeaki]|uniref:Coiled-coil domain-containing protein 61 n=1 Tax=Perkinsus chesapeaki TaxID=330153 RepID=A0A7J6LSK2_PERCH|nr:Coiled-coil domain-containing protein 61 [Perkinsus chesapeaki]
MTATVAVPSPLGAGQPLPRYRETASGVTISDRQNRIRRGVTRRFHDVDYLVEVEIDGDNLSASCEDRFEGTRWVSSFSSRFIEEITHRTGNFKSFAVFVQMLFDALLDSDEQAAVSDSSSTVTVDILTGRDLELLRHRNGGSSAAAQMTASRSPPPPDGDAKRYLILTYQVSYDRVHYPLALARQEPGSDVGALLRTIKRLSRELKEAYRSGRSNSKMTRSVDSDYVAGDALLRQGPSKKLLGQLEEENDRLARRCAELQEELENRRGGRHRGDHTAELKRVKENNARLQAELRQMRETKLRLSQTHRAEVDKLRRELNAVRGQERQLKSKVRSLENDLLRQRSRAPSSAGSLRSVGSRAASPVSPRTHMMNRSSRAASSSNRSPSPTTSRGRRPQSAALPRRPPSTASSRSRGSVGSAPVRSTRSPSPSNYASGYVSPYAQRPSPASRRPSPYRGSEYRPSPVRRMDTRAPSPVRGPSPTRPRRSDSPAPRPTPPAPLVRPVPPTVQKGVVATEGMKTAAEVSDIDARLMALQNFLRNTMKP